MKRFWLLLLVLSPLALVQASDAEFDFQALLDRAEQKRADDSAGTLALLNRELGDADPVAGDGEQLFAQAGLFRLRAELLRSKGDYSAAASDAERFAALAAMSGDSVLTARALFLRGTLQAEQGFFGEALEHFHSARQTLSETAEIGEKAMILNAIGMTHNFAQETERARGYFERALSKARTAEQEFRVATYLSNLASVVAELEGPEPAIVMQREVLDMGEASGQQRLITQATVNLCNLLVQAEQFDEARPLCSRALRLADDMGSARWRAGVLLAKGNMDLAQGELDEALRRYEDSLDTALDVVPVLEREALLRLAKLHVKRDEAERAGVRYQELLDFQEAALARERKALGEELEVRYQLERTQAELDLLRLGRELQDTEIRLRNAWLIALGVLLALTLLTVAGSLRAYRIRTRLQRDLARRNVELKEALAQISDLASTDPLTGLLNRRAMLELAQQEIARARREKWAVSVLMADIDHFKQINDSYGHAAGDELLAALAERLKSNFRESDLVARWGGEEFLCILPNAWPADAEIAIHRLSQQLVEEPIETSIGTVPITLTWGIARLHGELEAAIQAADQALYRGKRSGRNQSVVDETHH